MKFVIQFSLMSVTAPVFEPIAIFFVAITVDGIAMIKSYACIVIFRKTLTEILENFMKSSLFSEWSCFAVHWNYWHAHSHTCTYKHNDHSWYGEFCEPESKLYGYVLALLL